MEKRLKIGFFGDGPWASETIKKLIINRNYELLFIVSRFSRVDTELKKWAEKLSIDFLKEQNINSNVSIKKLVNYGADLFISVSYDQIIKKKVLKLPKYGFINCHAGALPFYRGRSVLNWVLINGESEFGVTVHYIDEGIDTGDIIKQKLYKISNDDDYASLLKRATYYCANLIDESLKDIFSNTVKKVKQKSIDIKGSYFKLRKPGDESIDWNQSNKQIMNFTRALVFPGPYAHTRLQSGEAIKIIKISEFKNSNFDNKYLPGTIVGFEGFSPLTKTSDGILKIDKYILDGNHNKELIKFTKVGSKFSF